MTLKIGSRSPKSNQLVPPSQQCICASLVKFRPSVQKITCGNEATRTPTPTGFAPKTICPPPSVGGHNHLRAVIILMRKEIDDAALSAIMYLPVTLYTWEIELVISLWTSNKKSNKQTNLRQIEYAL